MTKVIVIYVFYGEDKKGLRTQITSKIHAFAESVVREMEVYRLTLTTLRQCDHSLCLCLKTEVMFKEEIKLLPEQSRKKPFNC
jgi:hypothetical protein